MKDSYQKFADDTLAYYLFYGNACMFSIVNVEDIDEVRVNFALMISHLEYCDNFHVYPSRMSKQFFKEAQTGCCGRCNLNVKCVSGNSYWIGCNYGH